MGNRDELHSGMLQMNWFYVQVIDITGHSISFTSLLATIHFFTPNMIPAPQGQVGNFKFQLWKEVPSDLSSIVEMLIDKIALWLGTRANNWTAKRTFIASKVDTTICVLDDIPTMRNTGKLVDSHQAKEGEILAQCFPVYSLLLAMNRTTVDYFSLDVEGSELQVLKTIPFDKLDIKVLTVEFAHTKEGKEELLQFMVSKGYSAVMEVLHPKHLATDNVFVKEAKLEWRHLTSLLDSKNVLVPPDMYSIRTSVIEQWTSTIFLHFKGSLYALSYGIWSLSSIKFIHCLQTFEIFWKILSGYFQWKIA